MRTQANWSFLDRQPWKAAAGQTRLLVLTDNGCGSDCEYAVMLLSGVPGTVFAGQNTLGVGQFIQPGYFFLPHTRHGFRVALGTSDAYGDRRSFDGYGHDVDVFLTGRDEQTPEAIVELAERLLADRR